MLIVTGGIDPPTQAQVQIHLEQDRYQRGDMFKATLTEELGWGYDLYILGSGEMWVSSLESKSSDLDGLRFEPG